ncbi:hypothetical protein HK097_002599 [Rhizophlyctis rosea]|uniref:Uncharacterized protein n=1 Tax=Rhizophlyctis rosea TaxID=64517 RepID=A0AAD5SIE9_9FUNG|nr:hypothetical protein HK097_002599 [Rhizophlyctis rosea]
MENITNVYKKQCDDLSANRVDNFTKARPALVERFTERQVMIDTLKNSFSEEWRNKTFQTAEERFTYQYLVETMLLIIPDRTRRRDVAETRLRNVTLDDNTYLKEGGIQIRYCKKTGEKEVFCDFKDDQELKEAVAKLVKLRENQGRDHLFVTRIREPSNCDTFFKNNTFKNKMPKLGLPKLGMENFRVSDCKNLTDTGASPREIRDRVGHGMKMHETHYSIPTPTLSEPEPMDEDGPVEENIHYVGAGGIDVLN